MSQVKVIAIPGTAPSRPLLGAINTLLADEVVSTPTVLRIVACSLCHGLLSRYAEDPLRDELCDWLAEHWIALAQGDAFRPDAVIDALEERCGVIEFVNAQTVTDPGDAVKMVEVDGRSIDIVYQAALGLMQCVWREDDPSLRNRAIIEAAFVGCVSLESLLSRGRWSPNDEALRLIGCLNYIGGSLCTLPPGRYVMERRGEPL